MVFHRFRTVSETRAPDDSGLCAFLAVKGLACRISPQAETGGHEQAFPCLLIAGASLIVQASDRTVVYVATDGNDNWSGRLPATPDDTNNGPFATIHRAQIAVRDGLAASPRPASAPRPEMHTRGGVYQFDQPLTLTPQDSQTLFRAYLAERPVLSGGVRITGWVVGRRPLARRSAGGPGAGLEFHPTLRE